MPDVATVALGAGLELARREFWDYCQLRYPALYTADKAYLLDLCTRRQDFMAQDQKRFMAINLPPRQFKSLTGTTFIEWFFGREPHRKVMGGSYNETLSTTFARKVRNTIEERPIAGDLPERPTVYRDVFRDTRVKNGQAGASLWALEGSGQDSYLATSPGGTTTGFGANIIFSDDTIKNDQEAYNELVIEKR